METKGRKRQKRTMRSKAERRRIVEETLQAGASVARVARTHGVNANQVFQWRKLYREGKLGGQKSSNALLPVAIAESLETPQRSRSAGKAGEHGVIDIDLGHARVRIEGAANPQCVRAALDGLVR